MYTYYKADSNGIVVKTSKDQPSDFVQYWKETQSASASAILSELKVRFTDLAEQFDVVDVSDVENGFYVQTVYVRSALSYVQQRSFSWFKGRGLDRVFQAQENPTLNKSACPLTPSYKFLAPNRGTGKKRGTSNPIDKDIATFTDLLNKATDDDDKAFYNRKIAKLNADKERAKVNGERAKAIDKDIATFTDLLNKATDDDDKAFYNRKIAKLNADKNAL